MIDPMPSADELIWLFESEPSFPLKAELWPYTLARYALARGPARVELEIEPAEGGVRIQLASDGQPAVDLDLRGVRAMRIERRPDRELLGIDLVDSIPAGTLWLQTKPSLSLVWSIGID